MLLKILTDSSTVGKLYQPASDSLPTLMNVPSARRFGVSLLGRPIYREEKNDAKVSKLPIWVNRKIALAPLHFCEKLRGSDTSDPREGRGDGGALRGTTRRWSFHGSGRGRRPSASLCGNAFGMADESEIPGRCFREARRHPRAQSKRPSQNTGSK